MKKLNKDKVIVFSITTLCMLIILGLIILLTSIQLKAANLELENTIESNYSRMLLSLGESSINIQEVMKSFDIKGFGIYRGFSGTRIISWGDALDLKGEDLAEFFSKTNVPYFRESNSIGFDASTGLIRVIRPLGAQVGEAEFDNLLEDENLDIALVYISFSGDSYLNARKSITIALALFIFFLLLIYGLVTIFALQNVKYREKLTEQSSLVAMGEAARTLTHEIKNPLSAITLQLALLKRIAPEEIKEDLGVIDSETKKLIALTNRVSDFLRNPLGDQETVDLIKVINKNLNVFPSSIKFNHFAIKEAFISFDPDRLNSVIENVIHNAVDASELKGSDYDIELDLILNRARNEYILKVKDRGVGIKQEDVPKLFDPFFTTKVHGSGLGLPISKQFMIASGGAIEVKARQGGGAEVKLTFKKVGGGKKVGEENESSNL